MALIVSGLGPSASLSSSSSSCGVSSKRVTFAHPHPACKLPLKPIDVLSKSISRICFSNSVITMGKDLMTVKASSDIKGSGPDSGEPVSESDDQEEDVLLDELLDSKLQLKLEKKMRMKSDKRIRLRRKKLLRKRRMRKRGLWPPSKVNKLKNV